MNNKINTNDSFVIKNKNNGDKYLSNYNTATYGTQYAKRFNSKEEAIEKMNGLQSNWEDMWEIVQIKDSKVKDVDWDFMHKIRDIPIEKLKPILKQVLSSKLYKELEDDGFKTANIANWIDARHKELILKKLKDSKSKDSLKTYKVNNKIIKARDEFDAIRKYKKMKDANVSSSRELYNYLIKIQKAYDDYSKVFKETKYNSNDKRVIELRKKLDTLLNDDYNIKSNVGNLEGKFKVHINGGVPLVNYYDKKTGRVVEQYNDRPDLSKLNEFIKRCFAHYGENKQTPERKDMKFLYFSFGSGESNDKLLTKWNNVKITSSNINQFKKDVIKADANTRENGNRGYYKTDLSVVFSANGKTYKSNLLRIDIGDGINAIQQEFQFLVPNNALDLAYNYIKKYGIGSSGLVKKLDSIKDDSEQEQFKRMYNELINAFKKSFKREPTNEELKAIKQTTLGSMGVIKAYNTMKNDSKCKDDVVSELKTEVQKKLNGLQTSYSLDEIVSAVIHFFTTKKFMNFDSAIDRVINNIKNSKKLMDSNTSTSELNRIANDLKVWLNNEHWVRTKGLKYYLSSNIVPRSIETFIAERTTKYGVGDLTYDDYNYIVKRATGFDYDSRNHKFPTIKSGIFANGDSKKTKDSKMKDEIIRYKGYDIEYNFYGQKEYTIQYEGDDVWFKTKQEAMKFIDDIKAGKV